MKFGIIIAEINDLETRLSSFSLRMVLFAALLLCILLVFASKFKKRLPKIRLPLFIVIVGTVLVPTGVLFGVTIYLNSISDSGGPVHWHTDLEIWACDQELELRNPSAFLSNKIGTATYHEHNDKRIHLEGVVIDKEHDASLNKFMRVIGGSIDDHSITVPVEPELYSDKIDGDLPTGDKMDVQALVQSDSEQKTIIQANNGQTCGGQPAELQAFVFTYNEDGKTYTQTKLEDPSKYVMREEATVPPGDCLIIEFAPAKDKTNRLCEQYGIRDLARCEQFGVEDKSAKICSLRQVISGEGDD